MLSYFTSRPFKHYCNSLTECLWAMVHAPFKLQRLSRSRDECVCVYACMHVTEHAPVLFCFSQNDCSDDQFTLSREWRGISRADWRTVERTKMTGSKAVSWGMRAAEKRWLHNSYVAKGLVKKNQTLPGERMLISEYCDPREQLEMPRMSRVSEYQHHS